MGGLRRILPGGIFFRRFFITLLVIYTTKPPSSTQQAPQACCVPRTQHPTHTRRGRDGWRVPMSGLPGIVQNCHSARHKYQILHITTTAVHLSYRLLYFKPPNVAGKLILEAPYFRRFFLSIAEKRFLTSSPVRRFFFLFAECRRKSFLLHKTSSPFFCESPKNLEIRRLRRQSLVRRITSTESVTSTLVPRGLGLIFLFYSKYSATFISMRKCALTSKCVELCAQCSGAPSYNTISVLRMHASMLIISSLHPPHPQHRPPM